jgi:hypothetical protein
MRGFFWAWALQLLVFCASMYVFGVCARLFSVVAKEEPVALRGKRFFTRFRDDKVFVRIRTWRVSELLVLFEEGDVFAQERVVPAERDDLQRAAREPPDQTEWAGQSQFGLHAVRLLIDEREGVLMRDPT